MASAELGCSSTGAGVFSGTPLCTLVIPNSLLLQLHTRDCIDHINKNIKGKVVTLDVSCTRLEKTLQKLVGKVQSRMRRCKGSRDRKSLREAQTNVLVGVGETIAVEEVQEKLEVYKVLGCEWECIFCNMYIGEGSHLGAATRFVEDMLGGEET